MKYIIPLLLLFLLTGCSKKENTTGSIETPSDKTVTDTAKKEVRDDAKEEYIEITQCGNFKIVKDSISNTDKDNIVTFIVTYPVIVGADPKINDLFKKVAFTGFENLGDDVDFNNKNYLLKFAKEMKNENATFTSDVGYQIDYCNEKFLSMRYNFYGNMTPSAHPTVESKCINIDMKSGKVLTLQEVFKSDGYRDIILKRMKSDLEKQGYSYSEPDNMNEKNFNLSKTSLIIVSPYSSHAMVAYELIIPLDEINDIIKPEILELLN